VNPNTAMFKSIVKRIGFQEYLHNSFIKKFATVLGIDILVKASGFLLLPLFLRLMSQEEFGVYNYLLSIIQTFSLVLNLGLYIPQSKLYHSYQSRQERGQLLFTIATTLFLFLALFCFTMIVFKWDAVIVNALFDNHSAYAEYKGMILLSLLVTVFSFMLTNFFYTSEKIRLIKNYNIYRIVVINLVALSVLYFISGDAAHLRLSATYITELVLLCFFATYFVKELVPVFSKQLMIKSIKLGFPIMISALFGIVINFSDKFLLQKYGTLKELSNYYLAFSFASIIPLIFASLQNVWIPLFMKEKNIDNNIQKTKKLMGKVLLGFIPLSLCIWILFAGLLWANIIPRTYYDVIWILPLLLTTQIVSSITPLFSNYLVYLEKTHLVSIAGLCVSIISLAVGLWLIPIWGVYGAALSLLVSNFIYLVIYSQVVRYYAKRIAVGKG
jgi:O-antigen/teichoic acid export membrane protein